MTVSHRDQNHHAWNYVGGKWVVGRRGRELHDVVNPANGEVIARFPSRPPVISTKRFEPPGSSGVARH